MTDRRSVQKKKKEREDRRPRPEQGTSHQNRSPGADSRCFPWQKRGAGSTLQCGQKIHLARRLLPDHALRRRLGLEVLVEAQAADVRVGADALDASEIAPARVGLRGDADAASRGGAVGHQEDGLAVMCVRAERESEREREGKECERIPVSLFQSEGKKIVKNSQVFCSAPSQPAQPRRVQQALPVPPPLRRRGGVVEGRDQLGHCLALGR